MQFVAKTLNAQKHMIELHSNVDLYGHDEGSSINDEIEYLEDILH